MTATVYRAPNARGEMVCVADVWVDGSPVKFSPHVYGVTRDEWVVKDYGDKLVGSLVIQYDEAKQIESMDFLPLIGIDVEHVDGHKEPVRTGHCYCGTLFIATQIDATGDFCSDYCADMYGEIVRD